MSCENNDALLYLADVRIDELADERDDAAKMAQWYEEELKAALRENAKLRKLAEEMHPFAKAYMSIAVNLGCVDDKSFDWEMCMHELGIEVRQ